MIVVRHGLMTVGQPFSGKSTSMQVLAGALTDLHDQGIKGTLFNRIQVCAIRVWGRFMPIAAQVGIIISPFFPLSPASPSFPTVSPLVLITILLMFPCTFSQ